MDRHQAIERVRNTGVYRSVVNTPGWVWVVIGGVVLLIVGIVAATTWQRYRRAGEEE